MLISKLLPRTPTRIKDLFLLLSSLLILYLLHRPIPSTPSLLQLPTSSPTSSTPPTSLHHLLFSIASSSRSLPSRSPFLRLWHSPNTTRTYLFLDQPTVPNPHPDPTLPPTLVSSPTSSFPYSFPHGSRSAVRLARIVKESVSRLDTSGVRWFVFGDDDTVFFTDNLVRTLSKYDPEEWYYIGSGSEGYEPNMRNSFGMAFGGGGFAISASLARVLAGVLDSCLVRYSHLYGSDARVFSCLAELGVELTLEPGFHQVDARGDIFGMLSAHPLAPLLSLHHLDHVDPIFPNMTRTNALGHLFKAVNVDPGRVLQQTVCYDRSSSLTVSVAWGYAIQVFEGNYYLPDLLRKQRTFSPWRRNKDILSKLYMFDTSEFVSDPCKRPVVFFLESAVSRSKHVYTDYSRHVVGNCSRTRAVNDLKQIRVFSQKPDLDVGEGKVLRRQCCDILPSFRKSMVINIRQCGVDELMDVRGNIFGLLAAHPNTPLISLHHLDHTDPIFPNMTTTNALNRLLQASKLDPHRLLQQIVCYDRWFSWTVSVSWGYAVQVFATHVFLPDVIRTEQTFAPWKRGHALAESFRFDTRARHPDPCRRPVVFYFDGAGWGGDGVVESRYRRMTVENCSFDATTSPRKLEEIRVVSRKLELGVKQLQAPRRQCCNLLPSTAGKVMEIAIRECGEEELIYMHP